MPALRLHYPGVQPCTVMPLRRQPWDSPCAHLRSLLGRLLLQPVPVHHVPDLLLALDLHRHREGKRLEAQEATWGCKQSTRQAPFSVSRPHSPACPRPSRPSCCPKPGRQALCPPAPPPRALPSTSPHPRHQCPTAGLGPLPLVQPAPPAQWRAPPGRPSPRRPSARPPRPPGPLQLLQRQSGQSAVRAPPMGHRLPPLQEHPLCQQRRGLSRLLAPLQRQSGLTAARGPNLPLPLQ